MAVFTPDDERKWHAENRAGIQAGNAFDERARKLPTKARLELWRRMGEGEDGRIVIVELEARQDCNS